MRGLSLSPATRSSLGARVVQPWLGGFNLLPYRQRNARAARRRCLREWAAAAVVGCAGVLALAAWQAIGKVRIDAQRASIEQSLTGIAAPLAEHARLTRAQDEQRKDAARATTLSEPLVHLRDLLDALSFEPGDGVVLRQLRQREHDTELLATSHGQLASAEWLKRLGTIHGVKGVEVSGLHRPTTRGSASVDESVTGPIEFGAHLRWDDPLPKAAPKAGSTAARSMKSETPRGTK